MELHKIDQSWYKGSGKFTSKNNSRKRGDMEGIRGTSSKTLAVIMAVVALLLVAKLAIEHGPTPQQILNKASELLVQWLTVEKGDLR